MTTLYAILVFIHIFSAIIGIGPGFVLIPIVTTAKTMPDLKHAYAIKKRLHIFVMIGGSLLLVTGLLMGWMNPTLFHMGWYVSSLLLFLFALAMGPLVLEKKYRPVKELLATYDGQEIPEEYSLLWKQLLKYERIEIAILMIIIALMISKPF